MPTDKSNPIDHLAAMLKHCDNQRLVELTRRSMQIAKTEAGYSAQRAAICQLECQRRGIRLSR
jgi:hypothetical protein